MNPAAYPPIVHAAHILAEHGALIRVIGIEQSNTRDLRFGSHPSISVQLMRPSPNGWRLKLHYFRWLARTLLVAIRWRADMVYAGDPLAAPAGLAASLAGKQIIYHEHDAPPLTGPRLTVFMRGIVFCRQALAQRAMLCVFPGEKRVELFRNSVRTETPLLSVMNCPRRTEIAAASLANGKSTRRIVLHYHGSLGPTRLPLTVVEALRLLPDTTLLQVIGYESPDATGYVEQFMAAAELSGVSSRVTMLGPIPDRAEMLQHAAQATVGLLLMAGSSNDPNTSTMAGASNKLFEYVACGLSLVVGRGSGLEPVVLNKGIGVACDLTSPMEIADAVRAVSDRRGKDVVSRGREKALAEWNYEMQFQPVLERILGFADR